MDVGGGMRDIFLHVEPLNLKVGDYVSIGSEIANVESIAAPHLHIEHRLLPNVTKWGYDPTSKANGGEYYDSLEQMKPISEGFIRDSNNQFIQPMDFFNQNLAPQDQSYAGDDRFKAKNLGTIPVHQKVEIGDWVGVSAEQTDTTDTYTFRLTSKTFLNLDFVTSGGLVDFRIFALPFGPSIGDGKSVTNGQNYGSNGTVGGYVELEAGEYSLRVYDDTSTRYHLTLSAYASLDSKSHTRLGMLGIDSTGTKYEPQFASTSSVANGGTRSSISTEVIVATGWMNDQNEFRSVVLPTSPNSVVAAIDLPNLQGNFGSDSNGGTPTQTIDAYTQMIIDGTNSPFTGIFDNAPTNWVRPTSQNTIFTGANDDNVLGTNLDDTIETNGGNDVVIAQAGTDSVNGGNGHDILYGGDGNDYMNGDAGNDVLEGGDGNNHLYGGIGDDDVRGGKDADTLYGYDGNDVINGLAGNDFLHAGDGNDVISGDEGIDTIFGEGHNDLIFGGDGADSIDAGGGDDVVFGGSDSDTIFTWSGNDVLAGGRGNNKLFGGYGDDTYLFDQFLDRDTIVDEGGRDVLKFVGDVRKEEVNISLAGDTLLVNVRDQRISIVGGIDDKFRVEEFELGDGTRHRITAYDGLTINGTPGNDVTIGSQLDDTIFGEGGNDNFLGYWGQDRIYGGSGNDILDGDLGADTIFGGLGNDTLFGGFYEKYDDLLINEGGEDTFYGQNGNDTLIGSNDRETFYGGNGQDTIFAGGGNDVLIMYDEDVLQGGEGNDQFIFVDGDSTISDNGTSVDVLKINNLNLHELYVVEEDATHVRLGQQGIRQGFAGLLVEMDSQYRAGDSVGKTGIEFLSNNNSTAEYELWRYRNRVEGDTLITGYGSRDITLSDSVRVLVGNQSSGHLLAIGGDKAETFIGQSGVNTLYGGGGNDTFTGNGIKNIYYGGLGDDRFDGSTNADTMYGGDGNDTLLDVDQGTLFGGNGDDRFELANGVFDGGDGGDIVTSKSESSFRVFGHLGLGNDLFFGGNGTDEVRGDNGDDTIYGNGGNDQIQGGDGFNTLFGGDGEDRIYGGVNDEVISGGDGDDSLFGNSGNDTLIGGKGNDTFQGLFGNDTIVIGFNEGQDFIDLGINMNIDDMDVIKLAGQRSDWNWDYGNYEMLIKGTGTTIHIDLKSAYFNMFRNIMFDDGVLVRVAPPIFTLPYSDNSEFIGGHAYYSERIFANGGNDTIAMQAGDDTVFGGDGNDRIFGQIGWDSLFGGAGNDTLYGDYGLDSLFGDAGNDTLFGGTFNDVLNGGAGNDTLYGEQGSGTLIGGAGSDTYIYDYGYDLIIIDQSQLPNETNGRDVIYFGNGQQPDFLDFHYSGNQLFIDFDLGTGSRAGDGILVDNIGPGAQRLAEIKFVWDLTVNLEDIAASQHGDAGANHLIAGNGAKVLDGEAGNDTLTGSQYRDLLQGGLGDDTLDGGAGIDALFGGRGNDTYVWRRGSSNDVVHDEGGVDTIFLADRKRSEIRVEYINGKTLLIDQVTGETLTINDTQVNAYHRVERLRFSDGLDFKFSDITRNLKATANGGRLETEFEATWVTGSEVVDDIRSSVFTDVVVAGSGDDTIEALGGDDYIESGRGSDFIRHGLREGHDIIVDTEGQYDTVILKAGVEFADIALNAVNGDMVMNIGTESSITVKNIGDGANRVDFLRMPNGTQFTIQDIVKTSTGTDGSDVLTAGYEATWTNAGAGQDIIRGSAYRDVLIAGDGADIVEGNAGGDAIFLGNGADLVVMKQGDSKDGHIDLIVGGADYDVIKVEGITSGWVVLLNGTCINTPGASGFTGAIGGGSVLDVLVNGQVSIHAELHEIEGIVFAFA